MRMVTLEGAIVAVSGIAIGTTAALGILVPVSLKRLGTAIPAGSPLLYVATAALTMVLTLLAVLLPAWRATRGRPAESALAIE
jgi:putative ABC transport system permease protein